MSTMASQISSLTIVYSTVYSGADKKKTIKAPRHWPFCAWNSQVTGEFPAQMASNAKNVSILWRYHEIELLVDSHDNAVSNVTYCTVL